jgi:hypothetical protein
MNNAPFSETHQLNQELELDNAKALRRIQLADPTRRAGPNSTTLPGQPRVELRSPGLEEYLEKEFLVPLLDRLAPRLWLVRLYPRLKHWPTAISILTRFLQVSTPRSSHISALHHQAARGREIILVENPQLHLVWKYDKIFVKPIPSYLLSSAFWQYLVIQPGAGKIQNAAIGFMRSYSYLIQYEIDFNLAKDKGLIPKSDGINDITWDAFAYLITTFDRYKDVHVSPRYSYGELRLTRLNFYSRILLGKLTFHHVDAQWGGYLNQFIVPVLTIFAVTSVILNAMQVTISVQSTRDLDKGWGVFVGVSEWFAVVSLVFVGLFIMFMLILITFMFFHDIWFARNIIKKKRNACDDTWKTIKSGVV